MNINGLRTGVWVPKRKYKASLNNKIPDIICSYLLLLSPPGAKCGILPKHISGRLRVLMVTNYCHNREMLGIRSITKYQDRKRILAQLNKIPGDITLVLLFPELTVK